MAVIMVAMFPSLSQGMEDIAASMPPQLRGLVGEIDSFTQLDKYLASQLYDIRIPLFLLIMATILANGLSVGQEEKGLLRTTLSSHTSRLSWFLQTWFAGLIIFTITLAITGILTILSIWSINEPIDYSIIVKLALLSLSFAMTMYTIVLGIGAGTGLRAVTLAIGVVLIVSSFVLQAGSTVDWLDPVQPLSLLNYYDASGLITSGLNKTHQTILASLMLVFLAGGILGVRHRDIN
jgi:ABC-2 type transport system permease protein